MKRKILFIIPCTNSVKNFLSEIFGAYSIFRKNNFSVDFAVSTEDYEDIANQGKGFVNINLLNGNYFRKLIPIKNVSLENYAALYIPGGLAHMIDNKSLQDILIQMHEREGVIGLIGLGPMSLLNVKLRNNEYLIKGRSLTCLSNKEQEDNEDHTPFFLETALIKRGANYICAEPWKAHVVVDGSLITGQNHASRRLVAEAIIATLDYTFNDSYDNQEINSSDQKLNKYFFDKEAIYTGFSSFREAEIFANTNKGSLVEVGFKDGNDNPQITNEAALISKRLHYYVDAGVQYSFIHSSDPEFKEYACKIQKIKARLDKATPAERYLAGFELENTEDPVIVLKNDVVDSITSRERSKYLKQAKVYEIGVLVRK